jgi:UTP--glucose-1-phosphate uridylyltransferase
LPATKAMPKEMLPVVDKPLIQYVVEEAAAAGVEHFILVNSRGKGLLEDHFDRAPDLERTLEARGKTEALEALETMLPEHGAVMSVRQPEPLGLGHAVWCARHLVGDEPFAVLLPDDLVLSKKPCLTQMVEAYGKVGGNLAGVMEVPRDQTDRYGILEVVEDDGRLARASGLVEKPAPADAPSTLSIIGRYILQPRVFAELDRKKRGAGGEIQLTDAMAATIPDIAFHGFRFEGTRFDCGSKEGFLEANIAFALARDDMRGAMNDILRRYGTASAAE